MSSGGTHADGVIESRAAERNNLAWQRTAVTWLAAGAAVIRYFSEDGLRARSAVGWMMVAVGAAMWFTGHHRYHRTATTLRDDDPLPVSIVPMLVIAVSSGFVAAIIVAVELADW